MSDEIEDIFSKPTFAGEIIVARKESMNIFNTKIDDLAVGIVAGLPKFSKKEKMEHYCKKLQMVWEIYFDKKGCRCQKI